MRRGRQGLTSRTKVIGGEIKEGGLFISFVVTISFSLSRSDASNVGGPNPFSPLLALFGHLPYLYLLSRYPSGHD